MPISITHIIPAMAKVENCIEECKVNVTGASLAEKQ